MHSGNQFCKSRGFIADSARPNGQFELKAKLLCEGSTPDERAAALFERQNPSKVKRGGLSSGGKMRLDGGLFVNAPFYRKRKTDLALVSDVQNEGTVRIMFCGEEVGKAEILTAPEWYGKIVYWKDEGYLITSILTAHNRQLAGAVYEDCSLFAIQKECRFCVISHSLQQKSGALVVKKGGLMVAALDCIPVEQYGGLTLNGGMTFGNGRGMELIEPVARQIKLAYPQLPIAVEITPPRDLAWIDRLADAGVSSLMMNLETWDDDARTRHIPGKSQHCPKEDYLAAFERAVQVLGRGRVSTCFVVGTEPLESLMKGILEVVSVGVVPSPLAGRYFEDIPDYPFKPDVDWRDFLGVIRFVQKEVCRTGLRTLDRAGCVARGMCDLIKDLVG